MTTKPSALETPMIDTSKILYLLDRCKGKESKICDDCPYYNTDEEFCDTLLKRDAAAMMRSLNKLFREAHADLRSCYTCAYCTTKECIKRLCLQQAKKIPTCYKWRREIERRET
ncbi:hypothetical protein FACS1894184_20300 [Clostridia bacterium]|nr:hypothetical protein FACS1894184_20300 [Clostridia bacterium]